MKQVSKETREALRMLKAFARYQTHAGYRWALVMADGEVLCEKCTLENYRQIYRDTRDVMQHDKQWQAIGLTNDGESEETETCANCYKTLWEGITE